MIPTTRLLRLPIYKLAKKCGVNRDLLGKNIIVAARTTTYIMPNHEHFIIHLN